MSVRPSRSSGFALYDAPYLLLTVTALLWAINIVLGRVVAGHVPPVTLAFVRWTGATLILLPFALGQVRRDLPLIRRHFWLLVLLAATGIACYNAMSYYGLQYTQALNGLLVQSTAPLLVALWTFFIFRERLSLGQLAGIVTSLVGVLVIISHGSLDTFLHLKPNIGDVWIICALVIYAFYAAILRKRPALGPLSFLVAIMALGSVLLAPFALWEAAQGRILQFDHMTLGVLAYVMVGPSIVAYLFFNRGVELVGANAAAPFLHLMPVFGTALAIVFLGETMAWYHMAGYALVITGIALATLAARAKGRPPA
ncbi:DMT family transporter [Xanthobacter oligotrophicus]|uniref:DMT family transporter n=1 Tax=Xanthobacter oligotrophicus TaxID=2607286 RepID=UPI0011F37FBD|nr:DMT family transporter [Xanthobacter oligotrophicus]MCG5237013.1 DMT family transporter [Xanthobacter oligotrophicus]